MVWQSKGGTTDVYNPKNPVVGSLIFFIDLFIRLSIDVPILKITSRFEVQANQRILKSKFKKVIGPTSC